MNIFSVISLLGGLAMFLYGMRVMGDGLQESSSGALKRIMGKITSNPIKAFLLGLVVTGIIQSSTATIVITSGLVAAGILDLHQSLGIIIGANVGTTVTGQIIRLIDLDASGTNWLQFFKPNTLAPLALIIGMILIMGFKSDTAAKVGKIAVGFGVLFMGLLTMTQAVDVLSQSGAFEKIFTSLGNNPLIGYACGAGVAFILQSSSATIGILQALSISGQLTFNGIYPVLLGIYLGDCVTTAIVCSIGAKPEAKRVGVVNILFNLSETVVVFVVITVLHKLGLLDWIWTSTVNSGIIANTNTCFNLGCAIVLFPAIRLYEKAARKIVKDKKVAAGKYDDKIAQLNPVLYSSPALAFSSVYDVILTMFDVARENLNRAFNMIRFYDEKTYRLIEEDEESIDMMTDRVNNYLVQFAPSISQTEDVARMNHYYKIITEIERLGDHATNIAEVGKSLKEHDRVFTEDAIKEMEALKELIDTILDYTKLAIEKRDLEAAKHIEPLEEVVDDIVNALNDNHLDRLRTGQCSVFAGTVFLNTLSDIERISDICSNIGVATVARANPEIENQIHEYITSLHSGNDERFNQEYKEAHDKYFGMLEG